MAGVFGELAGHLVAGSVPRVLDQVFGLALIQALAAGMSSSLGGDELVDEPLLLGRRGLEEVLPWSSTSYELASCSVAG